MKRWTQTPGLVSPAAMASARELETRGFTQHGPEDLDDNEGIVAVDGRTGAHAPARYHRRGEPGADGIRPERVVEAYPDSPWADSLPYAESMIGSGPERISRLGLFRLNSPAHLDDVAAMYNGRAARHRDEAGRRI